MNKITPIDVKVNTINGSYYLDCTFLCEDDHVIKEAHMPRVPLGISWDGNVDIEHRGTSYGEDFTRYYANIGYGQAILLYSGEHGYAYSDRVVKEKVTEMTMDQLERKLGYKIKIVNKQEDEKDEG